MASTPPPATGDPRDVAWKKWAEGRLGTFEADMSIAKLQAGAAVQQATTTGNVAADAANTASQAQDRTIAADSNNRIARPVLDEAFWLDVIAGRRFVWELSGSDGSLERSTSRNVSWDSAGGFTFQPNGVEEGAEIDITPILAVPESGKIYVEAVYPLAPGLEPEIWVQWRDTSGNVYDDVPADVIVRAGTVTAPTISGVRAERYNVKLVRAAGDGLAGALDPKVFEVIGTGGLNISPEGVAVEDESGNSSVEINPSLPILDPPNAPILTSAVGAVSLHWNGSLSTGPTPGHLSYVYAEQGASAAGPWTRVAQVLNRAGDLTAYAPVGEERWYRFTAVDTSNRPSAPSNASSITVAGIAIPDLDDVITDSIQQALEDSANAWDAASAALKLDVTQYAVGLSETVPPTSGWSTATPSRPPGAFIWMRSVLTYGDDSTTTTNPVLLTGNAGAPGEPGAPGDPGRGVSSTSVDYAKSTNGTSAPSSGWGASIPATVAGEFLWTRTVTVYTDATTSTAYSVAAHGAKGDAGDAGTPGTPGQPGRGISSTAVSYAKSASGTVEPTTGWGSSIPATAAGEFLWARTVITYTSGTPATTTSYSVAAHGATGSPGTPGAPGASAYTVLLSNESHTFPGSATAALAGSTTSKVIAYQGTTAMAATIGTVTGQVAGLTTAISGNGTVNATITITVTTALTATSGTLTVPVTVGGQAFTKAIAWTVARAGAAGAPGTPGAPGNDGAPGDDGAPGAPASIIALTATTQVLTSPAAGGATTPATAVVTGAGTNATIDQWQYSTNGAAFTATLPTGVTRSGNVVTLTGATMTARTITVRMAATATGAVDTLTVAKVSDGATGGTGVGVSSITTYYRTTADNAAAPAAPTTSPPPSPWTTTEPPYQPSTALWAVTRVVYTNAAFSYSPVSKVAAYTAAVYAQQTADGKNAIYVGPNQPTPAEGADDFAQGDLWYGTDAGVNGIIGVQIWNGVEWAPYRIAADSVFIPGSVGTISLADGVVTAPKVAAKAINAEHVQAGSISVNELTPNIGSVLDININPAITDMQSDLEEQRRYYRFDSEGLKIGDPATNEELRLNPGRIEMVQAGNVPTWWEAQNFYVERMIVQAANIGSHRFEGYADGRTVIRPLRGV